MNLTKELIRIDSQISKKEIKKNSIKNYYDFTEKNEKAIKIVYKNLIEEKISKKHFKKHAKYLKNFNLTFNDIIKNEEMYLDLILATLIIKAFACIECKKNEDDERNFKIYESDTIINEITANFIKFTIWLEIQINENTANKIKFENKTQEIRKGVLGYIISLVESKIISKTKKWLKSKSLNFYNLEINYENYVLISLYKNKFKMYKKNEENIYIYNEHFTEIYEIFKPNNLSTKIFKTDVETNFFKNLFEIKAKIDYEILEFFFNEKIKKTNFEKNNLYENYKEIINQIKKTIKENDKSSTKEYSKMLSDVLDLIRIQEILEAKTDDFFYFPAFLCFRGRSYFSSSISFTLHKEFRCCLHLGEYEENYKEPFHPYLKRVKDIILKHIDKIALIKNYNLTEKDEETKISIIWILISIAEIKKKDIGASIKIEQFIEWGIKMLNNEVETKNLDIYDNLKFYSLKKTLREVEQGINIKRLISKDATASCFQHLIKILGNDSQESIKWCNLMSEDEWYDTYIYILNKWKNEINESSSEEDKKLIDKYFTRKSIKKPTMTIQYGASLGTCWNYFKNEAFSEEKDEKDLKKIKSFFQKYYYFINSKVGILKNESSWIIIALKKENNIVKLEDNSEIDLNYLTEKLKQMKITVNGVRHTKQERTLKTTKNEKKIRTSIRANYIHTLDSAIVRYVISIKAIMAIHDCYLADYRSTSFTIALINDVMQKTFHDLKLNKNFDTEKIFSIFIII